MIHEERVSAGSEGKSLSAGDSSFFTEYGNFFAEYKYSAAECGNIFVEYLYFSKMYPVFRSWKIALVPEVLGRGEVSAAASFTGSGVLGRKRRVW